MKPDSLIMFSVNGVAMIAKLIESSEKDVFSVSEPVMYGEAIDQNGRPVGSMMRPLNFFVSTPKRMVVNPDMWYYLDIESSLDKKIATSYERELDKIKAAQSGIVSPTNEDIFSLKNV